MRLTDLPLDRPVATLMLLLCLTVLGTVAIFFLPLDFMPPIDTPWASVDVPFPGSHPLEALQDVARPIEEEIAAIPGIKSIRSSGRAGEGEVNVEFDWSANIDLKMMEVREAVERARPQLPEGIGNIQLRKGRGRDDDESILEGRISADRNLSESWELLDRRIRQPLERIKGVARVGLNGVEPQELRIDLDLEALRRHGIEVGNLLAQVQAANLDMDLGAIRGDVLRYDVRSVARFRDLDTVRNLPLGTGGLRLRDVATVDLREPRLDYGRHLNRTFAIGIDVYRDPTANTVSVIDQVMERIGEIEKDPKLQGINLLVWKNAGEEIRLALKRLRNAGLFGGLLAIVVLYGFLRRLRTTMVVAVAIPFSLVVTCGGMFFLGLPFNVITLLGLMLGVGMLVDNAVVVMENIHRLQQKGLPVREAARVGTREVALAVLASTATTIIVWSWLFTAERSEMTILISSMALVICIAVVCSLLISLTFIPLAAARFAPYREVREGWLVGRLVPRYRRLLAFTLRHRVLTLMCLLALAATAAYPYRMIEKQNEPAERERAVRIGYRVHDSASKEVLEGYVDQIEEWLWGQRDELNFEYLYSWFSENRGMMTQIYLPTEEASKEKLERLRTLLQKDMPSIPGVTLTVGEGMWGHWRGGSNEVRASIALHGEDPEYLEKLAQRAEEHLRVLPNVEEIFGPSLMGQKEVRLRIDSEKARVLGVSPQTVGNVVGLSFRGRQLRRYQTADGEVQMILGLPDDSQPGLAALTDLLVPRPGQEPIPLGAVAHVEISRIAPRIFREDRRTTTWINVKFDKSQVPTIPDAQAIVAAHMDSFRMPEGYAWTWGRWGRDREEGLSVMFWGVLLSLLLVIILMAALFESFTQPLAIIITLPLAFFGAFWSLWLFGFQLDPVSYIGLIILIGIVVNNGIVMVDHVNGLRRKGKDRVEALIEGCGDRLRPVLMTAITTIFGLLPLAASGATIGNTYIDSMPVSVIGGLATSTLFTLLALPVWYTTVEDFGSLITRLLPRLRREGRPALPRDSVLVERSGS